ncbi:MAG TPA: phage tail protein, partial [Zoogloea sp.]|nr:phage tail protein [Zoogloea sp.]
DAANRPRKVPLMYKAGDVTLKRGMIASLDLWNWVNQVRRGNMDARATVVIQLLSEDHAATVASWKLINARPSKWTGPTLAAKGASDVAMEELTLVCEDLEFE